MKTWYVPSKKRIEESSSDFERSPVGRRRIRGTPCFRLRSGIRLDADANCRAGQRGHSRGDFRRNAGVGVPRGRDRPRPRCRAPRPRNARRGTQCADLGPGFVACLPRCAGWRESRVGMRECGAPVGRVSRHGLLAGRDVQARAVIEPGPDLGVKRHGEGLLSERLLALRPGLVAPANLPLIALAVCDGGRPAVLAAGQLVRSWLGLMPTVGDAHFPDSASGC